MMWLYLMYSMTTTAFARVFRNADSGMMVLVEVPGVTGSAQETLVMH